MNICELFTTLGRSTYLIQPETVVAELFFSRSAKQLFDGVEVLLFTAVAEPVDFFEDLGQEFVRAGGIAAVKDGDLVLGIGQ